MPSPRRAPRVRPVAGAVALAAALHAPLACATPAGTGAAPPPAAGVPGAGVPVAAPLVTPEAGRGPSLDSLFGAANRAARANDLPGAADALERAAPVAPAHPLILEALARMRALARDTAGALRALERLAPIGRGGGLAGEPALGAALGDLASLPAFARVGEALAAAAAPVVRSDTALHLREPDLLVEAIAVDPARPGTVFLGSMATGRVLRAERGAARTPTTLATAAGARPLGMRLDGRGRLWVAMWSPAAPALAPTGGAPAAPAPSRSALHVYDAATGALLRRHEAPADGRSHQFNDLAITAGGDVLVTDTEAGRLYRVDARADTLALHFAGAPDFSAPNGIALSPDGRRLHVAHLEGISTWDLRTGVRTRLAHPATVPLAIVDGLYACGDGLVAVQILAGFYRIAWLGLDADGRRVERMDVLEQSHPAHVQPTTGALVGDTLLYVANSEVRRHRPDGSLAPAARPSDTVVLRLPLGGRCR